MRIGEEFIKLAAYETPKVTRRSSLEDTAAVCALLVCAFINFRNVLIRVFFYRLYYRVCSVYIRHTFKCIFVCEIDVIRVCRGDVCATLVPVKNLKMRDD